MDQDLPMADLEISSVHIASMGLELQVSVYR